MKQHQLAINAVSTRQKSVEEALQAYHAAGFRNVEWTIGTLREFLQTSSIDDLKALHERYEMRVIGGFECALEAFSSDEARAENHQLIEDNARLLSQLGGTNLVVGTDGPSDARDYDATLRVLAQTLAEVAARVAPFGVNICIEFNWSPMVKSFRTACDLVRLSGAPNAGVLFDPAHYHCTPSKFEQLTPENLALIKHVHVDDMRDKPGEASDCNGDRVLPGNGILDLRALFNRIESSGYDGFFSIEMFSDELWELPAAEAAQQMFDSLQTLLD